MAFFWEKIVRPAMFALDAERAHDIGIAALRTGLTGPFSRADVEELSEGLSIECFGLKFTNPVGIAAGFDKNGVVVDQLASLGFGFVEVGTVTNKPQKGNPRPRLFRLPEDKALINRLGFNNDGVDAVVERLDRIERKCIVGVNIGKNRDVPNENAVEDYVRAFEAVHRVADYVAVNISSPNTPGLRDLQSSENVSELLRSLSERRDQLGNKPLLVKIAPDLDESSIKDIVDVCLSLRIDGVIATNTTVSRDGIKTPNVGQFGEGGLSGKPLLNRSDRVISSIYMNSGGKLPIIGVGGIFTSDDAFGKIAAGASLVQAYTGFVYGGPTFAADVLSGLRRLLAEHGFDSIEDAVGSVHKA